MSQLKRQRPAKYLFPFTGIADIHKFFKKMLTISLLEREKTIEALQKHGIQYTIDDPFWLSIEYSSVPKDIKLKDLLFQDNEARQELYEFFGVKENPDYPTSSEP